MGKQDNRKEIKSLPLDVVLVARCLHQAFSQQTLLELKYSEAFGISLQEWEEKYIVRFQVYFVMLLNSLVHSSLDNLRRSKAFSLYVTFVHKWQPAHCHRCRLIRSTRFAVLRSFILQALLQNFLGLQLFSWFCVKYLFPETKHFLKEIIMKLRILS